MDGATDHYGDYQPMRRPKIEKGCAADAAAPAEAAGASSEDEADAMGDAAAEQLQQAVGDQMRLMMQAQAQVSAAADAAAPAEAAGAGRRWPPAEVGVPPGEPRGRGMPQDGLLDGGSPPRRGQRMSWLLVPILAAACDAQPLVRSAQALDAMGTAPFATVVLVVREALTAEFRADLPFRPDGYLDARHQESAWDQVQQHATTLQPGSSKSLAVAKAEGLANHDPTSTIEGRRLNRPPRVGETVYVGTPGRRAGVVAACVHNHYYAVIDRNCNRAAPHRCIPGSALYAARGWGPVPERAEEGAFRELMARLTTRASFTARLAVDQRDLVALLGIPRGVQLEDGPRTFRPLDEVTARGRTDRNVQLSVDFRDNSGDVASVTASLKLSQWRALLRGAGDYADGEVVLDDATRAEEDLTGSDWIFRSQECTPPEAPRSGPPAAPMAAAATGARQPGPSALPALSALPAPPAPPSSTSSSTPTSSTEGTESSSTSTASSDGASSSGSRPQTRGGRTPARRADGRRASSAGGRQVSFTPVAQRRSASAAARANCTCPGRAANSRGRHMAGCPRDGNTVRAADAAAAARQRGDPAPAPVRAGASTARLRLGRVTAAVHAGGGIEDAAPPGGGGPPPAPRVELPGEDVICATGASVYQWIPKSARPAWDRLLSQVLDRTTSANDDMRYLRYLALPRIVLAKAPTSAGDPGRIIAERCRRFAHDNFRNVGEMWAEQYPGVPHAPGTGPAGSAPRGVAAERAAEPDRQRQDIAMAFGPVIDVDELGSKELKQMQFHGRAGEYSKAAAVAGQAAMAAKTRDNAELLRPLHPVEAPPEPAPPPRAAAPPAISARQVRGCLRSFKLGSSGGLSLLTPQHIKNACSVPGSTTEASLTAALAVIVAGAVPEADQPYMCGARLVGLVKRDLSLRPVAAGDVLRRMAGRLISKAVGKDARAYLLARSQVGVAVEGGADAAIAACRDTARTLPPGHVIAKLDQRNAFNSVWRSCILPEVAAAFPAAYPYARLAYGRHTWLYFGAHRILSQSGVQQGCPLGPLFFSLVMAAARAEARATLSEEDLRAITFRGVVPGRWNGGGPGRGHRSVRGGLGDRVRRERSQVQPPQV